MPHGGYTEDNVPSIEAYKDTDWPLAKKVYATMVDRLDADVGRVLGPAQGTGARREDAGDLRQR